MRRPAIFFLLAAVAAMLASMVVYSSFKKKDQEVAKALAVTLPIVVAAKDIPVGAKIDAGAIKLVRWPRNGLPPAAITGTSSVIGSVARSEFVENEPIVASRLVAGDKTSGVLPLMLPNDMRAMSVAVDEVSDMSGFVLPYTRVDVLLSLSGGDKEGGRSKIILQNIPVMAVAQTVERKDNPQPERVVTLEVTPEQAEELAVASTQGKLQLALRSYGDNAFVSTSGSNLTKVMGRNSDVEVPTPIPVQQSAPVRAPVRRFVRRPRPLIRVEVLRNGASRETVIIGRDGRAAAWGTAPSGASEGGSAPSAYVASLGGSDASSGSGTGDDGAESGSSGGGMTGGTGMTSAGVSTGGY